MASHRKDITPDEVRNKFKAHLPEWVALADRSTDGADFARRLREALPQAPLPGSAAAALRRLADVEGATVHELSRGEDVRLETLSLLWGFLAGRQEVSVDFALDAYHLFARLQEPVAKCPDEAALRKWMRRWPDGLAPHVLEVRRENKRRIMAHLVRKIEHRQPGTSRYAFPEGLDEAGKLSLVEQWWGDYRFHLAMAARTPAELNRMLGGTLDEHTLSLYRQAQEKGMPVFVTPYYLSLLNPTGQGYDDKAIRSYVMYSQGLVDSFGHIRAWEREDVVEAGKPNVAGWVLPEGHNIHRRYPDVAILIPDTMGRACGGLCASCQRMYDFQSKRLNFELESLRPKESWNMRLRRLMEYFEQDTQLRDILITGGDALMSRNATLRHLLEAVCRMAVRKREANRRRPDGGKYAELQRVRLGTRLPVYLPMRVDDELLDILRAFREKASAAGVGQFFIQTHFQSPLEVTPESREAIRRILSTGWAVTNQLVFNVAASRRGHTAKLRRVLNRMGVVCYYTFSVKGFEENYEVFAPNARSMQESCEEKVFGRLSLAGESDFMSRLCGTSRPASAVRRFCAERGIPFVATDRNVLNLPGIGKSMTFTLAGVGADGRRILRFDHDHTRRHSPVIDRMNEVYIRESKSLYRYLLQLRDMGEDMEEYASLWDYTEGETEHRFAFFEYPALGFRATGRFTNLDLEGMAGNVRA